MQATMARSNWTRQSSAAAYLEPFIYRPNLHVLVNTNASRILLSNQTGTPSAYGVEFVTQNGSTFQVNASREVILSAGAFNTPQLLMLSGIGPRWHLNQFDIPVQADLAGVGENLFDHLMVPMDFLATNQSTITLSRDIGHILSEMNLYEYFVNNTGPLTRVIFSETYVPSGVNGDESWPDAQCYFTVNNCELAQIDFDRESYS